MQRLGLACNEAAVARGSCAQPACTSVMQVTNRLCRRVQYCDEACQELILLHFPLRRQGRQPGDVRCLYKVGTWDSKLFSKTVLYCLLRT